jgi:hypothetical protein
MLSTEIFSVRLTDFLFTSAFKKTVYSAFVAACFYGFTHPAGAQFDREWKIFAVPFSHTDVGFTDTVPAVLEQHHEYLDSVLSYIEQTQHRDDHTRFKWTVEIPWPLESYLEARPADHIEKFMNLVRTGRIEIGAMHFGLQTDLCGPEELVRSLYFAKELQRHYDIPLRSVLINDTPGFTWSLAQILNRSEIPYLSVAMNSFLSDFFKTTTLPYLFKWEAQNGDRTLVWRSIHDEWAYLEGIIAYQMYGNYQNMKTRITSLLMKLQEEGYPYDAILINAATGDNGQPRLEILDNALQWNTEHENSVIKISTVSDFFDYVSHTYRDLIPVYSGDAPNWWSWHFASSATAGFQKSRKVQAMLPAAEIFASVADAVSGGYSYPDTDLRRAYIENLLYEDHNLGAANPSGNQEFWSRKMGWIGTAHETADNIIDDALGSLAGIIHTNGFPAIAVFNPTAWDRNEAVFVSLDNPVITSAGNFDIIDASTGEVIEYQILSNRKLVFHAENIPSVGYALFFLEPREPEIPVPDSPGMLRLENDYYIVEINNSSGGITGLYDRELSTELTHRNGKFNQYLYNSTYAPEGMVIIESDSGTVVQRVLLRGSAPGSSWYETEIILYNDKKRIDFLNRYSKNEPAGLEGVDFAYHFALPDAVLDYEIPFGHVRLFDDELSGFRSNHYAMQRWMNISSASSNTNVTVATDAAAVQAYPSGQFNGTGRLLISFNSTDTSYRAGTGPLSVNFSLTSNESGLSPSVSAEFAYNFNQALRKIVLPPSDTGVLNAPRFSFMTLSPPSLLLSTIKKPMNGDGYIIRLFNPDPEPVGAVITFPYAVRDAFVTTMLEDDDMPLAIAGNDISVPFNGFDIATIRILLDAPSNYTEYNPLPPSFVLFGNYPNPFNPSTNIRFRLPADATVRLVVYNILGQRIKTLFDGDITAGTHTVTWDGTGENGKPAPSGVYFYGIQAHGTDGLSYSDVQSMILLK